MKFLNYILRQRLFLLFLIFAAAMWYINKLGYRYKTEIEIPIELKFDYNSLGWVENPNLTIRCLVEGSGSDLFQNKVSATTVAIPITSLSLKNVTGLENHYTYEINDVSMIDALQIAKNQWTVFQILDTIPWIKISPMEDKVLPIKSNIVINCEKQFMEVGQLKLMPPTINVRVAWSVLDTMKYIQTEHVEYNNVTKSIRAGVNLLIPDGMIASRRDVRFSADVAGYTELEYDLPVECVNLPANYATFSVPASVRVIVKVPLRAFAAEGMANPTATIDYLEREKQRSNNFRVLVENLPTGGEVTSITPEFVEPFFKKID